MADELGAIRVGVRRWAGDRPAEPDEEATAAIGPVWLEVAGVRIPGEYLGYASHHFDNGDELGQGIGVVTVKLLCSDYQLVDHETGQPISELPMVDP